MKNNDNLMYSNGTNIISSLNDIQIGFLQRSLNMRTNEEEIREVIKIVLTHLEAEQLMKGLQEHLERYKEKDDVK